MKAEANFTANKGKKSDGGKKLPTPGNIGGEPVPGSGGTDRSVAESDVTKALIEQDKSLLKLQADYKGLFDEETNLHTLQIQAEIDLRKFNAQYKTLKGEHILVKAAATDEQIAQLKLNAANEDALTLYIKLAKAQITADDAVKKASVTSRQEVEINRIRIDVLKSLTATQDDAKVAVAAYNVKEAESALATAQANGTSKEKIIGLKAEVEIMKAKAEAAKELAKDDATETSRKNYLNLDEAIKKSTISSRQEVETNRIRIEVMKKFGATQNDVNVAIAEYNVQEAEAAVATAKSTGQSQEKILALEAEAAAMKSKSEAAKSIKTDDDAEVQRQKTFEYGWKNAFDNYTKNADSAAQMTQKAFDSVTSHMSDSLTNFVMTGKLDFADLAKSILADLAKIMVQKAMAGMVGSLMGGLFANGGAFQGGTQFFADGGVVSQPTAFGMSGGRTGVMGEAGAEAIMPLARGANGKLGVVNSGGGGGGNVVNHINVSIGSVDSEAKKNEMLKAINESIIITSKKTIQNEMRQGGMLTRRIA
jgi:lambda family phage tail tape measure protein